MMKLTDKKELLDQIVYCIVEGDMSLADAIQNAHKDIASLCELDSTHYTVSKMDELYINQQIKKTLDAPWN